MPASADAGDAVVRAPESMAAVSIVLTGAPDTMLKMEPPLFILAAMPVLRLPETDPVSVFKVELVD